MSASEAAAAASGAPRVIAWDEMEWLNPPPAWTIDDGTLEVRTGSETDFWRRTAYDFIHDDGHFLGYPLPAEAAIEVTYRAELSATFDQAGVMLRADPETWIKAGVERADGTLNAGAVVTAGHSDWSMTPLPDLAADVPVTVRASRSGNAVTIRYGIGDAPPRQLLRLAHVPVEIDLLAGPMCCSPTREGLVVRFDPVRVGPPDAELHDDWSPPDD